MRERTNTEDLYAVAVIRRSTVVGHVPRNMSACCALFLRRNHLRMVLFTRAQSCHEKFGHARVHCACALCVWVVLTSCLSLARIKFGDVLAIRQTAKLKSRQIFPLYGILSSYKCSTFTIIIRSLVSSVLCLHVHSCYISASS